MFTSKERDAETGLDFFGARHMSSAQGRFTSPGPGNAGAFAANPQSWNAYSYVVDNPLKYTDPHGLTYQVCDADGKNCANISDAECEKFSILDTGRAGIKIWVCAPRFSRLLNPSKIRL